jgi:hypothetical protein
VDKNPRTRCRTLFSLNQKLSDFKHVLGKNLSARREGFEKLLLFFFKLSDFEHVLGKNLSVR